MGCPDSYRESQDWGRLREGRGGVLCLREGLPNLAALVVGFFIFDLPAAVRNGRLVNGRMGMLSD